MTAAANQTTADRTDTRKDANSSILPDDTSATPSANNSILRRIGVSNGNLIIGAEYLRATDYDNSSVFDINDIIKMTKQLKAVK